MKIIHRAIEKYQDETIKTLVSLNKSSDQFSIVITKYDQDGDELNKFTAFTSSDFKKVDNLFCEIFNANNLKLLY